MTEEQVEQVIHSYEELRKELKGYLEGLEEHDLAEMVTDRVNW